MRNISEMGIIVIDVTNMCNKSCSNCTRFCGHYQKDEIYFMNLSYFKKAVESLIGYNGIIGIIGGEPTLHPKFLEICDIFRKVIKKKSQRGLWSNTLTKQFNKYRNTIEQTFGVFNFNNHIDYLIKHTPVLTAIDDFRDLSNDEKVKLIDNCWLQKNWSATVTPKGAYFCEVAGTLAWLFNGIDGWDITLEQEWWQKKIPDYVDQIHYACYKCGCCVPLKPRLSSEGVDDVSISNLKRLKKIGSPKIMQRKYNLFKCVRDKIDKSQIRNRAWYWRQDQNQFSGRMSSIFFKR